ncbi:MAG: hypothetical protein II903_04625 [Spirochaetales bacterium]|nr:hypothetical protein [Spirochaetales bacterium]
MKRLLACLIIAMIAFLSFAAINVTIDTITQYAGPNDPTGAIPEGFSIGGADEKWFADINATMSNSFGTALVNLRAILPNAKYDGAGVEVHGWEIKAKLNDWLKMSIGNTALELYTESISWEPVFGAGLFEQGANRIYFDIVPDFLSDLRIIAGMSMGQDPKAPWKTFQAAAVYEIPMEMYLSAEFSMVAEDLSHLDEDGAAKTFSFQADYIGTENLNVVAGYSLILAEGALVQHRFDLFGTYTAESFAAELYDALLIRLYEGEGMGNRLAGKFTYYMTEKLSPMVSFNWFNNYGYSGEIGGFAWGDCQLLGPGIGKQLLTVEPAMGFTISDNVYGSIGANLKINLSDDAPEENFFWSIPLCLTATF